MSERGSKGKSLIAFPKNYTVLDLETTGYDPHYDNIIEFAAIRVRNSQIVDTFSTLLHSCDEVDKFITELTGITNDMLAAAPSPEDMLPVIRNFIGDDIIIGHNVNFDINFLYDWFAPFTNDFVDTLRISRKVFPELQHHRLIDMAQVLKLPPNGFHRALADCQTTLDCYKALYEKICLDGSTEDFINNFYRKKSGSTLKLHNITTDKIDFDDTHPIYGKHCVFTGTLERMTRTEAAQCVVDMGGICDDGITRKTNFLILGETDYRRTGGNKSSKHRKAEEYKLSGIDIEIIPESVFYDMLEE